MVRVLEIINQEGTPFTVVHKGDHVEFYDARYKWTEYGQFVSAYYTDSLLDHGSYGLDLHGGVPSWKIDKETFSEVLTFLEKVG